MKTLDLTHLVTATRETSERLTKALKLIGVEVKTHYWNFEMQNFDGTNRKWEIVDFPPLNKKEKSKYFPAYTVTDCLAVLPESVELTTYPNMYSAFYFDTDDEDVPNSAYEITNENPAEALALLAIKGIEEGWITRETIV